MVAYRDFPVDPFGDPEDFTFYDVLPFSTDSSAVTSALESLPGLVGGGNDWEESVYSALMHTIDATSLGGWRGSVDGVDVSKAVILMGDAPPHDPEPFTGYTLGDVDLAAFLADPVQIFPVLVGDFVDPIAEEIFSALASGTGGFMATAAGADDVTRAILSVLDVVTPPNPEQNPVPEPTTLMLLMAGAVPFGRLVWRKGKGAKLDLFRQP